MDKTLLAMGSILIAVGFLVKFAKAHNLISGFEMIRDKQKAPEKLRRFENVTFTITTLCGLLLIGGYFLTIHFKNSHFEHASIILTVLLLVLYYFLSARIWRK